MVDSFQVGLPYLLFAFIVGLTTAFLDFEELKTVNYGIDILNEPVMLGKDTPSGALTLTSKYGQQYQCSFPDKVEEERKEKEEEKAAIETGIPDLLKPMESSPCLIHTKDWWSYEFCYGKYIRQYHLEDGKIASKVIYLGFYESEYDWHNQSSQKESTSAKSSLSRYHSQQYVNGTTCDITNQKRRAEVRFLCEEGHGDYVARLDEPETCVYTLTIHTTKICHHPYLKPKSPNKPVPITCNPLLTQDQYDIYLAEKLQAEKQAEEEATMRKLRDYKIKAARAQAAKLRQRERHGSASSGADSNSFEPSIADPETGTVQDGDASNEKSVNVASGSDRQGVSPEKGQGVSKEEHKGPESSSKATETGFRKATEPEGSKIKIEKKVEKNTVDDLNQMVANLLKQRADGEALEVEGQGLGQEEGRENNMDLNMKVNVIKDPMELRKYMNALLAKEKTDKSKDTDDAVQTEVKDAQTQGGRSGHTEPERTIKSRTIVQEKAPQIKHTDKEAPPIKEDTTLKFKRSEKETDKQPKETEETPEDPEIMKEFDKGLDKIAPDTKKKARLAKYKGTIKSAMHSKFNEIVDESLREMKNEGMEVDVDKKAAFGKLAQTLSTLLSRLEKAEKEIQTVDDNIKKVQTVRDDLKKSQTVRDDLKKPQTVKETQSTEPREDKTEEEDTETTWGQGQPDQKAAQDKGTSEPAESSASGPKATKKIQNINIDNRVRVRVTRLKQSKLPGQTTSTAGKTVKLHDGQKQKLEQSVKDQLQKAGMDTKGRKIEVKIITAGYYDADDDSIHILSDEESSAFNKMIVKILGGDEQAAQERRKHLQMENNYNFVWGQNKKKTKVKSQDQGKTIN